jgi:hypothetical protein
MGQGDRVLNNREPQFQVSCQVGCESFSPEIDVNEPEVTKIVTRDSQKFVVAKTAGPREMPVLIV